MVMGDTATTPDQWLTAGNLTIFQGGGGAAAGGGERAPRAGGACGAAARRAGRRSDRRGWRGAREGRTGAFVQLWRADRRRREARGRPQDRAEEGARLQGDRQVDPARRHSGEGHRRVHLCPRRSRARHAACPRDPARRSRRAHRVRRRLGGTAGGRVCPDRAQGRFPRRRRAQRMGGDQGGASHARDVDRRHRPARTGDGVRDLAQAPVAKEDVTQNVGDAKSGARAAARSASRRPTISRCRRTRRSVRPARSPTSRTAS